MRIFLDANVLFSGAKADGAVRELLRLLSAAGHELCVDGYVVEEARRNLALKAPERLGMLDELLSLMDVAPAKQPEAPWETARFLPEKDRPVLAAAIRKNCDALVTGDRTHFGRHFGKTLYGVTIHSPRSIAEALLKTTAREPLPSEFSRAIGRALRRAARRARETARMHGTPIYVLKNGKVVAIKP